MPLFLTKIKKNILVSFDSLFSRVLSRICMWRREEKIIVSSSWTPSKNKTLAYLRNSWNMLPILGNAGARKVFGGREGTYPLPSFPGRKLHKVCRKRAPFYVWFYCLLTLYRARRTCLGSISKTLSRASVDKISTPLSQISRPLSDSILGLRYRCKLTNQFILHYCYKFSYFRNLNKNCFERE